MFPISLLKYCKRHLFLRQASKEYRRGIVQRTNHKAKLFAKIVDVFQSLIILTKGFVLDSWLGFWMRLCITQFKYYY